MGDEEQEMRVRDGGGDEWMERDRSLMMMMMTCFSQDRLRVQRDEGLGVEDGSLGGDLVSDGEEQEQTRPE